MLLNQKSAHLRQYVFCSDKRAYDIDIDTEGAVLQFLQSAHCTHCRLPTCTLTWHASTARMTCNTGWPHGAMGQLSSMRS